jgi:cystathionine gamma-synthase
VEGATGMSHSESPEKLLERVRRHAFPESTTIPLVSPLYASVVYRARDAGHLHRVYEGDEPGYTYAREGHPNAELLARRIAELEGAEAAAVTASGMAALAAVLLTLLDRDAHWIASDQLYGRTLRLARQEFPRLGIACSVVAGTETDAYERAFRDGTRLVLVELVSNPLVRVVDLERLAEITHRRKALLVVDNTFPTPLGCQPLKYGADVVLHSVTKMIAGHSDCTVGVVCGSRELIASVQDTVATWGLHASPWDCWLAERGLETLELRLQRCEHNAMALALALSEHPVVRRVYYPGLPSHPDHERARRLLGEHCGTVLSFELHGGRSAVDRLLSLLPEIPFAPTLGDVCTLLTHPLSSSHRRLTEEEAQATGITPGLMRVSCGVEPTEALVTTFLRALDQLAR